MHRDCNCDGWKKNIDKVNAPILREAARSGGAIQYDGEPFNFCPWCGSTITTDRPDEPDKDEGNSNMIEHKITIKGVSFSMDECKALYRELEAMFGHAGSTPQQPHPAYSPTLPAWRYPELPESPNPSWNPWIITAKPYAALGATMCQSFGDTTKAFTHG